MKTIKHNAARHWAAFAIFVGISLSLWALNVVRPQIPPQDPQVIPPAASANNYEKPTTTSPVVVQPTQPPEIEEAVVEDKKSALYLTKPKLDDRIGTISLPTLDLSWPIFEGTEETQLGKGVGHFIGSVLPGIEDNVVLSGHRTTVFNRLGELSVGDLVMVKTSAGIFTYQVRDFRIVLRTDRTVIVPTPTAVLTLTTCYPFNYVGITTKAFIVTADLMESKLN